MAQLKLTKTELRTQQHKLMQLQKYLPTLNSFAIPAIACSPGDRGKPPIDAAPLVFDIIAHRDLRGRVFGGGSFGRTFAEGPGARLRFKRILGVAARPSAVL